MKAEMEKRIMKHAENIETIFGGAHKQGMDLCKWLRRKEAAANRMAVDWCNGDLSSEDWEAAGENVLQSVNEMLGNNTEKVPVFVNGDARGYTLKIKDEWIRENEIEIHKDWGGFGILAPDLSLRD